MRYLVHFIPGECWVQGLSIVRQPFIKQHGSYIQQLFDDKLVFLAGPFTDGSGGACVVDAADENDIKSIFKKDPAVENKVITVEIRAWNTIFDQNEGKSLATLEAQSEHSCS